MIADEIAALAARLARTGYVAEPDLATCLELGQRLGKPLLLEGDAGVGKTAIAQALAEAEERELVRLQCYEGLDLAAAVYEWDYQRQLLAIRQQEAGAAAPIDGGLFARRYLLERPLMRAITSERPVVLLIDEIDRADEAFEAYLLELLSDWQISVPELGTVRASSRPTVVLTANGTRELSDALRRRCLYYFLDYPDFDKELRIVRARLPEIDRQLAMQLVAFIQRLRERELRKQPGIAESLDWAAALMGLELQSLRGQAAAIEHSLVCLLKTREDRQAIDGAALEELLAPLG